MQRAAASSPNQPTATSSRTFASAPPSKRRRIDTQLQPDTPSPSVNTPSQLTSTPDSKMAQDTQSRAREGGETEWILKINLPRANPQTPQVNGHGQEGDEVEDEEDEIWANQAVGRQSYGSFKRKKAQTTTLYAVKDGDSLSSASDSDESLSSPRSSKAPRYDQGRNANGIRAAPGPPRSAQAPKRFFDQISRDGARTKNIALGKQSKKQQHHRKKPRITI